MDTSTPAPTPWVDYYALLGVPREAPEGAVKQAYRRLVLRLHPDLHENGPEVTRRFQVISEAYAVLGDPVRRAAYDADVGGQGPVREPAGGVRETLGALLDSVFGVGKRRDREGKDRVYRLEVDLGLSALGGPQDLVLPQEEACVPCEGRGFVVGTIPEICHRCAGHGEVVARPGLRARPVWCEDCQGRGYVPQTPCPPCLGLGHVGGERNLRVDVPAGVSEGARLLVRGAGEPGRSGGTAGDLLVEVSIRPHKHLRREGEDIVMDRPISVYTSLLGGEVRVPTVQGVRTVKVPAGTCDGTLLRLTGYGVGAADGPPGDQLIRLRVEAPKSLRPDAITALEAASRATPAALFPRTAELDLETEAYERTDEG